MRLNLYDDSLAERSKAPDSSSGGEIRVGSNPTAVTLFSNLTAITTDALSGFFCTVPLQKAAWPSGLRR